MPEKKIHMRSSWHTELAACSWDGNTGWKLTDDRTKVTCRNCIPEADRLREIIANNCNNNNQEESAMPEFNDQFCLASDIKLGDTIYTDWGVPIVVVGIEESFLLPRQLRITGETATGEVRIEDFDCNGLTVRRINNQEEITMSEFSRNKCHCCGSYQGNPDDPIPCACDVGNGCGLSCLYRDDFGPVGNVVNFLIEAAYEYTYVDERDSVSPLKCNVDSNDEPF